GGGCRLKGTLSGSTTASPLTVGNQSRPSRVLQPAGWQPLLHSRLGRPSARLYLKQCTVCSFPLATRSSSSLLTRNTPAPHPHQRLRRLSSAMQTTTLSANPCLVVKTANLPCRRRFNPSRVPIQRLPSASG